MADLALAGVVLVGNETPDRPGNPHVPDRGMRRRIQPGRTRCRSNDPLDGPPEGVTRQDGGAPGVAARDRRGTDRKDSQYGSRGRAITAAPQPPVTASMGHRREAELLGTTRTARCTGRSGRLGGGRCRAPSATGHDSPATTPRVTTMPRRARSPAGAARPGGGDRAGPGVHRGANDPVPHPTAKERPDRRAGRAPGVERP